MKLKEFISFLLVLSMLALEITPTYANNATNYLKESYISDEITSDSALSTENTSTTFPLDNNLESYPVQDGNIYFNRNTGMIVKADDSITEALIPRYIGNTEVIGIAESAFKECTKLTRVAFPSGITKLEKACFFNCLSLSDIKFSSDLKSIDDEAFYNCKSLTSIDLPYKLESLGSMAFAQSGLKEIIIPRSVKNINENAFNDCDNLTIHCYSDSYAEEYAAKYAINYVLTDRVEKQKDTYSAEIKYGDVDGNSVINAQDAALILSKTLNEDFILEYPDVADVDKNGTINAQDAALVLSKALNADFEFSATEDSTETTTEEIIESTTDTSTETTTNSSGGSSGDDTPESTTEEITESTTDTSTETTTNSSGDSSGDDTSESTTGEITELTTDTSTETTTNSSGGSSGDDTSESTTGEITESTTDTSTETTTNSSGGGSGGDVSESTTETTTETIDHITSSTKLTQDVHYSNDLIISADVDLNGYNLTVDGNIIQDKGAVSVNGGKIYVGKDYRIQNRSIDINGAYEYGSTSACLIMNNENDYVLVNGSFITNSHRSYNNYSAGILEVKGNFYQYGNKSDYEDCFNASGTHKVILSGTEKQVVYFDYPSSNGFNELEITNDDSNIVFETGVRINDYKKDLHIYDNLELYGSIKFTGSKLDIDGNFIKHYGDTYFNGAAVNIKGEFVLENNLYMSGGNLNIEKDFIETNGSLTLDGGKLTVAGDYRIQSRSTSSGVYEYGSTYARLIMKNENDYVLVNGSFITHSYVGNNYSAGILEVKGNFYQYGNKSDYSEDCFNASGTHKVILSGTEKQVVHFDYPSSNGFNELQVTNNPNNIDFDGTEIKGFKADSTIIFNHDVKISSGTLYVNGQNVIINGSLDLSRDAYITGGILNITGDLRHRNGGVKLNKGSLVVEGSYQLQDTDVQSDGTVDITNSSGYIQMSYDEDIIKIGNDFIVQSNYKSTLTNGVIEIGGNFTQKKTNISNNFYCSDSHIVILNGGGTQTITFESPSNIVEYVNSSGTSESYNRNSQFNYLITDKDISNYSFNPAQKQFISSSGNNNYYALIYNSTIVSADTKVTFGRAGVSSASGNYSESFSDLTIPAAGVGIDFGRTYNSMDNADEGLMGKGWRFSYSSRIEGTNETKSVTLPNGSVNSFEMKDGSYVGTNTRNILIDNGSGYTLTNKDQSAYIFNSNGYLTAIKDKFGNQVEITVDDNGKITKLTDQSGYSYSISYSGNYISSITDDNSGKSVSYGYDDNKLISFTDVMGCTSTFEYNENGKLCTIKNSDGNVVESLTYITEDGSDKNKVLTKTDRSGNTTNYDYNTNIRCTTMTDSNGRVTKQYYDSCYNITKTIDAEGGIETISYFLDDKGQSTFGEIRSKTDRNGNTTTYTIDDNGNIVKVTYPDGSTSQYVYNNKNNVIQETNQEGRKVFYIYDSDGIYLKKLVTPFNNNSDYSGNDKDFSVTEYTYYDDNAYRAKGLIKTETSPLGAVKTNTYYADGTLKSQTTVANGRTVTENYTYNTQRLAESYVDGNGNVTKYDYDKRGQIIRESKDNGNSIIRIVYNQKGEKIQEIMPELYNSSYDNISSGTYADSNVGMRYQYNIDGTLASKTDSNGNKTLYTYDMYGNVLTETYPNGLVYRYTYDNIDRQTGVSVDGIGNFSTTRYSILSNGNTQTTTINYIDGDKTAVTVQTMDYAGRMISQVNPDKTTITNKYDKSGLLISSTDAKGNTKLYSYNSFGLVEQEKVPVETVSGTTYYNIKKYEYDKDKNKTCIYQSNNAVGENESYSKTEYTFDGFDNMIMVKNYKDNSNIGNIVQYYYDNNGNKLRMYTGLTSPLSINGLDSITVNKDKDYSTDKYVYNYDGKVISHTDSMGYTETYSYNKNGQIIKFKDKNGNTLSYSYDKNGNITAQNGNKLNYNYSYDSMNRRISASGGGIKGSYSYDKLGRLLKEDINGSSKTYTYDRVGNILTKNINYGSSNIINQSYTYDNMNRIIYTTGDNGITAGYTYDNNGNRTRLSYGNGIIIDYSYNQANLIKSINVNLSGNELETESYSYYTDGNQKTKDVKGMSENKSFIYNYDGLSRLIDVNYNGNITAYTYDDYNNRLSKSENNSVTNYVYDKNNRLLSENGTEKINYTYDKNGNLIKEEKSKNTLIYNYDELDRLTSITGNKNCNYTYDFDNQRLSKNVGNTAVNYIWSNGELSAEYDKNGVVFSKYIYGTDRISCNDNYYIQNAHTDVVALADINGNIIKFYNYDAFGNEENISSSDTNPFRYSGEYFDSETGNYYLNNRYYNPSSSRFITEDKYLGNDSLSVSLNKYTYCNNNPIMYIDSSGNVPKVVQFAIGALTSGTQEVIKAKKDSTIRFCLTGSDDDSTANDYKITFLTEATKGGFSEIGLSDLGDYVATVVEESASEYYSSKEEKRKFNVENVSKGVVQSISQSTLEDSMTALVSGIGSDIVGKLAGTAVGLVTDLAKEAFNPGSNAIAENSLIKGATWLFTKSRLAKSYDNYIENEYTSDFAMRNGYRNEFMAVKDGFQMADYYNNYVSQNFTKNERLMRYDEWRKANKLKNYKMKR